MSVRDKLKKLRSLPRDEGALVGVDLRLDLAKIILETLRAKGLSQKDLADKAEVAEAFISQIVHSDNNCTFETAGKILRALDLKGRLVAQDKHDAALAESATFETFAVIRIQHGEIIGQTPAPNPYLPAT